MRKPSADIAPPTNGPATPADATAGLHDALVEAIAERVAAKLASPPITGLVTARVLAERLSVSVDFVYAHADQLGVVRLGNGPKARLRFDLERAEAQSAEAARRVNGGATRRTRRRREPALPPGVPLIPGRSER